MAKPRNKVVDCLQYLACRAGITVLQMHSLKALYRLARVLAWLICRFDRVHFQRAVGHLRRSFPDWPDDEIDRVARASIRSIIYMLFETVLTPRLIQPHRWRRHVKFKNISEVARLLIERKQAVAMVTGHFGNWEIAGYTMATIGLPSYTVARHIDNRLINDLIFDVREKAGQRMIYKKGAAERIHAAMEAKATVSFVGDQDAGRKGLYVDFFGREASTFKSIGLMVMEYRIPLVVVSCRRLGETFRFEITPRRIIHPHEWADKDDPLRWITQEFTTAIEQMARRCPEQYFWVHRRWKHRPKGQERTRDGIF